MTDQEIIKAYLSGNQKMLPLLVKRWHLVFCQKAHWIVKDADMAKDIAQESWVIILDKLSSLQQLDKFKYWAFKIVYSKSIDTLNKVQRDRNHLKEYDNSIFEEENSTNDPQELKKQKLLNAINELSIEKQHVIRLFYLEQYAIKEIAQILEISEGTVKSRLFKAREELKQII